MKPLVRLVAACLLLSPLTRPVPGGAQTLVPCSPHLPPQAVVGSTPERLAAYNALTPDQREAVSALVRPYLQSAMAQALAQRQSNLTGQDLLVHAPNLDGLLQHDLSRALGMQSQVAVQNGATTTMVPLYPATTSALPFDSPAAPVTGSDLDHDGLPDNFENRLADAFTPVYFVSRGEQDNFATFLDAVPETVAQRLGPNPLSYFRVKPLGFATGSNGVDYGIAQINYLTLWDHDSGLSISGTCDALIGVAGGVLGISIFDLIHVLSGHNFDDEHSAALVAAPSVGGGFNLDATQYFAISYFTAAHEGTFFDHSAYLNPATPIPADIHLPLALSLSKHSTYAGNPDGLPLMPDEVIAAYYETITDLYLLGIIDDLEYDYLLFVGDSVFFGCIVEHFSDQGGVFASPRINVGEPVAGSTLNGSGFILDPAHVLPKLTETLWLVGSPPLIVNVNPASVFLDGGQSQQLQANVLNAPGNNQGVTWSLDPAVGTLTAGGLYTAPSLVGSTTTVTVTACSTSNAIRCGTATIFLNPVAVTVAPKTATLAQGQSLQLTAAVTHTPSSGVTWSLSPQVGTLSAAGLYTAPGSLASDQTVTATACSVADPTRCDAATITLKAPDFSVSATPASQTVTAGGNTSYTVSLASLFGFTGTVALSVSGLPSGATASFTSSSLSGTGSSTLSIATSGAAPAGAFSLTITGTSGALTHSGAVTLNVQGATVTLSPTTATPDFTAYTNPANAEDRNLSTFSGGVAAGSLSGEIWSGFGSAGGTPTQIKLSISSSASCGDPNDGIELTYSLDGGNTYLGPVYIMGLFGGPCVNRAQQTDVISLPTSQDLSQVRVLAMLYSNGASSHRIYDVWIEVTH